MRYLLDTNTYSSRSPLTPALSPEDGGQGCTFGATALFTPRREEDKSDEPEIKESTMDGRGPPLPP